MYEFLYNIHYRRVIKIRKPDGLSRHSGEQKSAMDAKFFEEGQVLDLEEDENDKEGNADDIELAVIDVSKWHKCNRLRLVAEEHRLEVVLQHHDSPVAGPWRRQRTEELVSRNFT